MVCNFAKPYLLNGLTIADWVINENLGFFWSHCNDSCHGSTVLQSAANEICNKDFFFYLLTFEFYSDIIAFASIGQISVAVKELSFPHL